MEKQSIFQDLVYRLEGYGDEPVYDIISIDTRLGDIHIECRRHTGETGSAKEADDDGDE